MKKTVVELFAGVGGFRLGLEASDWEVIWGNQWEPGKKVQHAFNCYSSNFKTGKHVNEDITKIDAKEIPDHPLLVGGFPCQDYSVARTGAEGIQGKKGVLFWEIKRIIEEKRPNFVLLENVDRLLKSPAKQRGRDFAVMLKTFDDLGYSVEWRVVNAAEYGFSQKRKRVFIFATKNETEFYKSLEEKNMEEIIDKNGFFAQTFQIKKSGEKSQSCSLEGDVVDISENFSYKFENSGYMKNSIVYTKETTPIEKKPNPLLNVLEKDVDEKYYLSETQIPSWKYLKDYKVIERTSKTGHTYKYSEGQMSFPDPLDKPGRTILTSEGSRNRSSHVIEDPETKRLRRLTPIECERLNGFPDNWTSTGMTERMRYFVMGNALVVDLIKMMGNTLSEIIKKEKL